MGKPYSTYLTIRALRLLQVAQMYPCLVIATAAIISISHANLLLLPLTDVYMWKALGNLVCPEA